VKRIFSYIRPYVLTILLTLGIKFTATLLELMIPRLMEYILSSGVSTAKAGDYGIIWYAGVGMVLCAGAALAFNILANRMSAITAGKITRTLRHDLFQKLEGLSSSQMDKLTTSSAVSRLTSDTYNVNQLLARLQRIGIRAPILLIGGIVMALSMDATLSLILLGTLPIISVTVLLVTKKTVPLFTKTQDIQDQIVQVCQENITGIRVIKALSKTEHERQRFNSVNEAHNATALKAALINNITGPVTNMTMNLGLTLVVLIGAFRVNSGHTSPTVIVALLQYFTMILTSTMAITRVFIMWNKGEASARRIADVLELPQDLLVEPVTDAPAPNAPHIQFSNVSFSYTGVGKNLDNLNFSLERGQTLGIWGATGSGKSTILNLLLRLYDVTEGQILLDGQDIRTIPYEDLRKKFGVVFQNDFITEGTIAHNISFFRELPPEKLEVAAQCAQAEFIAEKEGQMEAEVVVRGNNLSGGQKQRLLIARALAADPEILILDDASSALDYQTDANLRRALRENFRNTTTVVVAQRVSSLRHADLILVLEDGAVIGAGTHDALMDSCEEYRIIAQTQMGDGKEAL